MAELQKVAVFVDVQNIYYTTRDAFRRSFSYRRFWQQLSQQQQIVAANAYAIYREGDDGQAKFRDALKHIGFEVKTKPFIQRADGSAKGDWDVGIAIDMLDWAPKVDKVILLSGDGDFDLLLLKVIREYGIEAEVYGVETLTANALINAASRFHPIGEDLLL